MLTDFLPWGQASPAPIFYPNPSVLKKRACLPPSVSRQGAGASVQLEHSGPLGPWVGTGWAVGSARGPPGCLGGVSSSPLQGREGGWTPAHLDGRLTGTRKEAADVCSSHLPSSRSLRYCWRSGPVTGLQLIKPVMQPHVKINLFSVRNSFQFANNIHINNLI